MKGREGTAHLLLLLMFNGNLLDLLHIILKPQLNESLDNVIGRNRLFRLLFANFVGFGRDEVDKLDAAIDKEVP